MQDDKPESRTTKSAPPPWRVEAPNKQYMRIVDGSGNRVCDFFPHAGIGGRGWDATHAIATRICEWANRNGD